MAIDPYSYSVSASEYSESCQPSSYHSSQPSIQFSVGEGDSFTWSQGHELVSNRFEGEVSYSTADTSIGSTATSLYQPDHYLDYRQQKERLVSYDCSGSKSLENTYYSDPRYSKPYERTYAPSYAEAAQSTYQPPSHYLNHSESVAPTLYEPSTQQSSPIYLDPSMRQETYGAVSWKDAVPSREVIQKTSGSVSPDVHFPTVAGYPTASASQTSSEDRSEPAGQAADLKEIADSAEGEDIGMLCEEETAAPATIPKPAVKSKRKAAAPAKQTRGKGPGINGTLQAPAPKKTLVPDSTKSPIARQDETIKQQLVDDDGLYITAAEKKAAAENEQVKKRLHQVAEQRRRWSINTGYAELRRVVPECENGRGSAAVPKAAVLARATMYIRQLREYIDDLKQAVEDRNEKLETVYRSRDSTSGNQEPVSSRERPGDPRRRPQVLSGEELLGATIGTSIRKPSAEPSVTSSTSVSVEETCFSVTAGSPHSSTSTISPVTSTFPSLGFQGSSPSAGNTSQGAFSSLSRASSVFVSPADELRATSRSSSDTLPPPASGNRDSADVQSARDYKLPPVQPSHPASRCVASQDTLNPPSQLVRMPSLRRASSLANSARGSSRRPSPAVTTDGTCAIQGSSIYSAASDCSLRTTSLEVRMPQTIYRSLLEPSSATGIKRKEAPEVYSHQYAPYSRPRMNGEALPSPGKGEVHAQTSYVESQTRESSASGSYAHGATLDAHYRVY